jgi:hypothetical protein
MIQKVNRRPFELVLDQIIQILSLEIPNQAILSPGEGLEASIYKSRFVPFQATELPAINVDLARGDYGLVTAVDQDGVFSFNIDVYQSSNYSSTDRGDTLASQKLQRLVGVVQAVLMAPEYITLGFDKPFIENRTVKNIQFASPVDSKDANSVVMARISLDVRVCSNSDTITPNLIKGFDTQALINGTVYGHIFSGDNIPGPIIPVCANGEVRDQNGLVIKEVASGGFVVVLNSKIKNSSGVEIDQVAPEGDYSVLDSSVNLKNSAGTLIESLSIPYGFTGDKSVVDTDLNLNGSLWLNLPSAVTNSITLVDQDDNPISPILSGNEIKVNLGSAPLDPDAESFLNASGIIDSPTILAINSLVLDIKESGAWSKLQAIYPLIGTSELTSKFNLKNPIDSDSAFRLVFNGGWTFSASGITPNGTDAYINTKWTPSVNLVSADNFSFGVYTPDDTDAVSIEIGVLSVVHNYAFLRAYTQTYFYFGSSGYMLINKPGPMRYRGLFIFSRIDSLTSKAYIDGAKLTDTPDYSGSADLATGPFYLGARNTGGSPSHFSQKELSFAFMGEGLNDIESKSFYSAVELYQVRMGRAI